MPPILNPHIPLPPYYHQMLGRFERAQGERVNFVEFFYESGDSTNAVVRAQWGRVDRDQFQFQSLSLGDAWQWYRKRKEQGFVLVDQTIQTLVDHQRHVLQHAVGSKGVEVVKKFKM